jgi:hypothetical protein
MSQPDLITRLLGTSGDDAGCEGGMALLAEYVEGRAAGLNVSELFPTLVEHLRNCPACEEDCEGLVALARGQHGR